MTGREKTLEEQTRAHLDRLIMDGTITVNKPGNGRDIKYYLRSGKFAQFQMDMSMALTKLDVSGGENDVG